jgi:hypothetical protein
LWRPNHFCDCPINFIFAQIKYSFRAPNTCADCTLRLRAHRGNAGKENGSRQHDTISEKMRALRIGGGRESIRARKIYDYDCAGDVNESGTFPRTHGKGRDAHLAV